MIAFLNFLLQSWRVWVTTSLVGAILLAVPAFFFMKPIYRAEVLLSPSSTSQSSGLAASLGPLADVAAMTGLNLAGAMQEKVEALAALQSRKLIISFIERNDLLPVLFSDSWDAQAKEWKYADQEQVPTLLRAHEKFTRNVLGIVESQTTGLVSVTVDWGDPVQAAEWANGLVFDVNKSARERAIADADRSLAYLTIEFEKAQSVELRNSIARLIEAQIEQRMLASVREDYAFRVIDPAVVRAPSEYHSPKRLLMIIGGGFLGFLFGLLLARELGDPDSASAPGGEA